MATPTDLRTQPPAQLVQELHAGDRAPSRPRLRGVDVARGLAVVGMLFVDNRGNGAITGQLVHASWNGLHVADVVFPVFLLVVGVSLPFSTRAARPRAVLWRVVKLTLLGWLIVTAKYGWGGFSAGVLGHIAGAYLVCWLILRLPRRAQLPLAAALLAALTALLVVVPVPGTGSAGMTPDSSWATWFDQLLGLGGAEGPHAWVPSAVTVLLGVLAGRVLLDRPGVAAVRALAVRGGAALVAGGALAFVVPVNKQIWTPSYVLVTGGIGLGLLALTHWLVDVRGIARPLRPFEVLGLNAIVAFAVSELLFRAVLGDAVQPALVRALSGLTSPVVVAYAYPLASVLVIWGVCAALLRRGIVVRL